MSKQTISWERTDKLKGHRRRTGQHNLTGKLLQWAYCKNCRLMALKE